MKQFFALWALSSAMGFCTAITKPAIVNTSPVKVDSQFVVMRASLAAEEAALSDLQRRVDVSLAIVDSMIQEREKP